MALSLRTGLSAREAARIPGKPIAMVDSSGEWDGAILFVHTAEQLAEMGERRPPSPRMADSDDDGDDGSSDSGSERAGHGRERRRGRVGRGAPYAAALEEAVRDAGGSDAVRRLGLLRAAGRMAAAPVRDPRAKKLSKLLRRMDPPARRTGRTQREIHLPPGAHFTPLPSTDPKARDIFYVTGPSGCGKSTWAMNFARNYYRWWGGSRPTFLISKLPADEVMDGKEREGARARAERPTRIDVRELLDKPFDWRGLGASLVIFDDCDTFTGAEEAAMQKLQDEIATLGRHETISMLVRGCGARGVSGVSGGERPYTHSQTHTHGRVYIYILTIKYTTAVSCFSARGFSALNSSAPGSPVLTPAGPHCDRFFHVRSTHDTAVMFFFHTTQQWYILLLIYIYIHARVCVR